MGSRVIHFGPDDCHRLMVLRSAGYAIDDCRSLIQLRDCLAGGPAAEALLMSDSVEAAPLEAVALARAHPTLPVIFFCSTNLSYEELGVDLVVHCLTPPEVWLDEVDSLIEKCRLMRAGSPAAVVKPGANQERLWEACARPPASQRLPGAERIRPKEHIG